ncbi:exosome non-catalytic core subunit rrp46 [Yamadazyma tenuis]|uniref:Exoribonuclease phosphorolytic domain-containing protein n=1 Tax=Candida tenuis (strain ATCC 10573 / BCRC 21748 / CBS 615 / JCM 9827 / NBRC 10315 / NRRL Y-1498 / VKM Y-70) TaxID=590646 RepID=G3B7J5_CANTC|nr:uncharacterized protein CANTEDRAFT_98824 [Yamadazyma tenuis ATCC 10573]EGV61629.1 hypothetical protein CANTEDRAFT_98824 [Yamadazyma tenuis ATCC 10573]WEJ92852.1 exosome non-catalytic core subunit rrp46 [Yamadazyma tenuis]
MLLRTSVLENVDGSAELTNGRTKVLVSVSGPIEPKIKQELPNLASLEIILRPSIGTANTRENLLTDKLRSILSSLIIRHKYPRQLIQVVVQVLSLETDAVVINNFENTVDDLKVFNIEFTDIINCCYFALLDSNIFLYESFIGVSQSVSEDKSIINTPELSDLIHSKSHHLLVFSIVDSKPSKIVYADSKGEFSKQELFEVMDNGFKIAGANFTEFRQLVEKKIEDDFVWKQEA